MAATNFPKEGDNKAVSLRNSNFARFDLAFAESLREKYPAIWGKGGNIKGNAQYRILSRIAKQGGSPKTRAEEKAIRLREAWAARHYGDHRVPGVVAQIKWLVVGELGESKMKSLINEEKEKADGRATATKGRGAPAGNDPPQARGAEPADDDRMLVRTADVRAVRREDRPNPATGEARKVVVVEFVASTEIEDSHESIVKSNWDLTRFLGNPVLLWMHGRQNDFPAVGNVENLHKEGTAHVGLAVFDDTTQFDRDVALKYEKGVLKGFSIGFYPRSVRWETQAGRDVLVLDDIELMEISCVNVPSNPEALARQYAALRARAVKPVATREANTTPAPALPAPTTNPTSGGKAAPTGDRNMAQKNVTIEEREVQMRDKGATCAVTCPNCNEKFDMAIGLDVKKSADYADIAGKLATTERTATEHKTALDGATARVAEFERINKALTDQIVSTRVKAASDALKSRSGEKLFPAEFDAELAMARGYLSDLTPDPEAPKEDPTRTIGEKRFAERLAVLDARPSLRMLGAPQTTTPPTTGATPPVEQAVRDASGEQRGAIPGPSTGGAGLADFINTSASN